MTWYQPWEDALISAKFQSLGAKGLVELLPGRTPAAINCRAGKLGVTTRRMPEWTLHEDNIVKRCHPDMARALKLLPHRTRSAIKSRFKHLRLGPQPKRWTLVEDALLRSAIELHSDEEIAAMLGRSAGAIEARRLSLGLLRRKGAACRVPVIGDLIAQTRLRGVKLSKLSKALKCRQISACKGQKEFSINSVARVVKALGGELYAEWED